METILEDDLITENSTRRPLETLGDYLQEYRRINQQIVALEIQISILQKSAEWYDTEMFEPSLHQLDYELYLRKKEIGPIIMIVSHAISRLVPDGSGEMIYEHFILGHGIQEIAHQHETTNHCVEKNVSRFLKTSVPSEAVVECGEILRG